MNDVRGSFLALGLLAVAVGCGTSGEGTTETTTGSTTDPDSGESDSTSTDSSTTEELSEVGSDSVGSETAATTLETAGETHETTDAETDTTIGETEGESEGETEATTGIDCEGPGCFACDVVPGEPQRLFGLTWNFAMGEPGSGLGLEELRCIVPETGETDLIVAIPGMDWLPVGSNAYDTENEVLYAIAFAADDNIHRLFSIHTIAGELLANPPLEQELNWSGGIHVRSDNVLVGVTWNPEMVQEELRVIDPQTAQSTLIGPIPEIAGLYIGLQAYDIETDTIYLLGTAMGEEGTKLFVVDAHTGETLGAPTVEGNLAVAALQVRNDGALVAIAAQQPPNYELMTIDTQTAALTTITAIEGLNASLLDGDTYDPLEDVLYVVDSNFHLLQVDASSGEVLANPKLDAPNSDYDYNWSGGIHMR